MDMSTMRPGQRASITYLDGPLLICAGAGSGKTFTLTQRIAWALMPGSGADGAPFLSSIDEALVITFTNKAAGEIKDRIRQTLRAEGMQDEALKVDSAWVSTIHGMCNRILHEHALEFGLDPAFELASDNDAADVRLLALNQVVARAKEAPENPYGDLFSQMEADKLDAQVSHILDMVSHEPAGFDAISFGPAPASASELARELLPLAEAALDNDPEKHEVQYAAAEKAVATCNAVLAAPTPSDQERLLQDFIDGKNYRQYNTKPSKPLWKALGHAQTALELAQTTRRLHLIVDLARDVETAYRDLLAARGLVDMASLVPLTLRALHSHPQIAAAYTDRFKLIMVDEFQDTSQLQIDMIECIAGTDKRHLCTVGDSQQSIYRFQGADVGVYLQHKRDMLSDDVGAHIEHLVDNFRSHGDILAFVRRVCGQAGYFVEDFLDLQAATCGRTYHGASPRIELTLTTYTDRVSNVTAARAVEAAHIADRFAELRAAGHKASDMVVLMGTTTGSDLYADALRARGFSCVVAGGSKFFQTEEALVCQHLLNVLANPYDSESLLIVFTSDLLPVSSDDLLFLSTYIDPSTGRPTRQNPALGLLRSDRAPLHASPLLRHALEVLNKAWARLGSASTRAVFMDVVVDSGWLGRLEGQGPQGQAKAANILKFARMIDEEATAHGFDVARIACALDERRANSTEKMGALSAKGSDAVRIMTVHSSKGLEFPIVAVTSCYTTLTRMEQPYMIADHGILHTAAGTGGKADPDDDLTLEDAPDLRTWALAIQQANAYREYEERKRLFYVAATRASDALIVAMTHKLSKSGAPQAYKDVETDLLEGLFPGAEDFPATSGTFSYGGSEPGTFTRLSADENEEDAPAAADETEERPLIAIPEPRTHLRNGLVPVSTRADFFSYSSIAPKSTGHIARGEDFAAEDAIEETVAPAGDADKATDFGSALHRACEWLALQDGEPAEEEWARALTRFARIEGVEDIDRLTRAFTRWLASPVRTEAASFAHRAPEVPFHTAIGGRVLEGSIDLLCTNGPAGTALIVDYKTGGSPAETPEMLHVKHLLQAQCYAFATLEAGYEHIEAHFVRVEQDDGQGSAQTVTYRFDRSDLDDLRRAIVDALETAK